MNSRPRPVSEAPVDSLLDRVEELARRWAVALILARPLDRLGELPLEDLALEAPALFGQAIRALVSDTELERMAAPDGADGRENSASARRLGALAGARDPQAAVAAVEALRGVLWDALLEELSDPPARQVADLADRLAYVCATALTATIVAAVPSEPAMAPTHTDLFQPVAVVGEADPVPSDLRGAIVVDERDEDPAPPPDRERRVVASSRDRATPAAAKDDTTQVRPFPWDLPPSESREASAASRMASGPEIEIKDQRHEDGPAAWISSIGRALERFEQDRLPFAVLLVELFDLERLGRVGSAGELSAVTREVELVLAHEPRVSGSLTRERPGRYWLLAPVTDGLAARALAERLVRALGPVAQLRGIALPFAVGTAVCPDDGRDAPALAAHADLGLCDARPAQRSIGLVDRPAEGLDLDG
jgi:hypothetical protein